MKLAAMFTPCLEFCKKAANAVENQNEINRNTMALATDPPPLASEFSDVVSFVGRVVGRRMQGKKMMFLDMMQCD